MYRVAVQVQGGIGGEKSFYGQRGRCRFCGSTDPKLFRQHAHLVPESLGNRTLFFLEECDGCNQRFSVYEDALAAAVGPLLTLGGTVGKRGKVRQTGRTGGDTVLTHHRVGGKRQVRIMASNVPDYADRVSAEGEWLVLRSPLPATPFKPLLAYKALLKVALSLVPHGDVAQYTKLIDLLANRNASMPARAATIGLSFGMIGASPPIVGAYLLERTENTLLIPRHIFLLCAGSVCTQIFLYADDLEHSGIGSGTPTLEFTAVLARTEGAPFRISYGKPHVLDWSSDTATPQPVREMELRFHPGTLEGVFAPLWRSRD